MAQKTPFTNESILHLWWYNGHIDLVETILTKVPKIVEIQDGNGDTAFHLLWRNTTSQESDLILIFQYLKEHGMQFSILNCDNKNGVNLLIDRIKNKNPYDGNLNSIRLLYWNILDSVPKEFLVELK